MATGVFTPPTTSLRLSSSLAQPRSSFLPASPVAALPSRSIRRRCLGLSRIGITPRRGSLSGRHLHVRCGATMIDEGVFDAEVLQSEGPVLVEFVADWCGPCRLVAPIVDWAAEEYKDRLKFVKIDHDANPKLIEEYKVYGLPALILFTKGQEVPESRREGAITKVKLKEYLDSLLESISVS